MTDKKLKVEFAPGAFNQFEGTQEELDELLAEIQNMFANSTPEEIEAMSRPMSEEDFEELPEDVQEQILRGSLDISDDLTEDFKRKLQ
jgi:hypothetical protein